MRLILDSHSDLAWIAMAYDRDVTAPLEQIREREAGVEKRFGWGDATSCLPEMRRGGIAICVGTLAVRMRRNRRPPQQGFSRTDYDHSTPALAYAAAQGQLAYYRQLERDGEIRIITSRADLDKHWQQCSTPTDSRLPVGVIISMECADAIVDPQQAAAWFADGLRSVMLTHYGENEYACGTASNGPLAPRCAELLHEFERLGMILDVSHLSDRSFYEATERFSGPLMASHNNSRALVPGDRQFTDEQIRLLISRGAVIGVVCDAWMLQPNWEIGRTTPDRLTLAAVADQIDHVCQLASNVQHVGIGSDIGGGYGTEQMPNDLKTIADLQRLAPLLAARGYSEADIDRIFHANWLDFFRKHLPQ